MSVGLVADVKVDVIQPLVLRVSTYSRFDCNRGRDNVLRLAVAGVAHLRVPVSRVWREDEEERRRRRRRGGGAGLIIAHR